ncbi:5470_t:CDS:2 [Ambispora gerdemannii]|uniref:lipoyl(octanoyl) transferase n=1 Tax=Ambispora gerdemannii TaxID=144530 RepID=A0A9N9EZY5_9GLOM|nr:5470_t:CDS:2 [Ambispora gerdemannii]
MSIFSGRACSLPLSGLAVSTYLPYIYLSQISYAKALSLQAHLVTRRLKAREQLQTSSSPLPTEENERLHDVANTDILLLLQHSPTYTTGRRDKRSTGAGGGSSSKEDLINNVGIEEKRLREFGAEYFETLRGGQTTFHGPGQLIGYPILNLQNYKLSVRCYVAAIERVIIETCAMYGIKAQTTEHTGVWANGEKICAIGIQVQRYITSHGFALNCNTDLSWFDHIIPCGLIDKKMTSIAKQIAKQQQIEFVNRNLNRMQQEKQEISVEIVLPVLAEKFGSVFGRSMRPLECFGDSELGGLRRAISEALSK